MIICYLLIVIYADIFANIPVSVLILVPFKRTLIYLIVYNMPNITDRAMQFFSILTANATLNKVFLEVVF